MWDRFPQAVKARSSLLITRFDKLTSEKDKSRVLKRVKKETDGLFGGTFPISLTQALAAGEDEAKWDASGAAAFTEHLIATVQELTQTVANMDQSLYVARPETGVIAPVQASKESTLVLENPVVEGADQNQPATMPRRVVAADRSARPRPTRDPNAMTHPSQRLGQNQVETPMNEETQTQIAS